jgi:hypothetical protein
MKTLRDLRRFILAKSTEGNQAEIRAHVSDNLDAVASAFHVSAETIVGALESVYDDAALATQLLETIRRAEVVLREHRRDSRTRSAQASAEALATAVQWQGDRAHVDMPSLFASALTRRDDLLVFTCEDVFTVGVYMAPLLDLAKIHRVQGGVSGWVDAEGLHLRWGRAGGLHLRPQEDADAAKVILALPSPASVIAA